MKSNDFQMPDQRVSEKQKKTKKWHILHANTLVEYLGGTQFSQRLTEIAKLEQLYLAKPVKRASVTSPHGEPLGENYEVYPLIESVIDSVVGKYLSRPPKRSAYSINREAVNSKLDAKVDMMMEDMMRQYTENINATHDLSLETDNPDLEIPDNIEEHFLKTFKTHAEEMAEDLITQFLDVNRNKERFRSLLTEYLYGDTAACYIGQEDGHPKLERYRYDECYYDIDPSKEVQDNVNVWASWQWKHENEILNEYPLDDKNRKKVTMAFQSMRSGSIKQDNFNFDNLSDATDYANCSEGTSYRNWYQTSGNNHRLRVMKMQWKSRRDIRYKEDVDKITGEKFKRLIPKSYRKRNNDKITTVSVETIHHIDMIGPEVVLSYGELKERHPRIDSPAKSYIPAIGLIGRTDLKGYEVRSLARKLKGLQQYASDILYQMKLFVNQLEGKVLVYDVAQTPKEFIQGPGGAKNAVNRVFHHMRKDKVVLINSKDKGQRNTFNQFTTMDLSNRGYFQDLMNALILIEDLSYKFSGLQSSEQEGGEKYDTATSINRKVLASHSRLEVYFEPFDNFIGSMLTRFLQVCKYVYDQGEVFQQIFGDGQTKFFTLYQDFFEADLGIYIGDSAKNFRDKQNIDRAAEMALSTANDPRLILDLISVLEAEEATEGKAIFERSVKAMEEIQEAREQMEKEMNDANIQEKQDERVFEAEQNQLDRENKIEIAKIQANAQTRNANEQRLSNERIKRAELESQQGQKSDSSGSSSGSDSKPKAESKSKPEPAAQESK
jgi:hypothetical protein